MHLTAIGFQQNMSVIESESRVHNHHIVGHLIEVIRRIRLRRQRIGLRKDGVTGIGVEDRVDDEGRATTMVDTDRRRAYRVFIGSPRAIIHEDTVGYRQFG